MGARPRARDAVAALAVGLCALVAWPIAGLPAPAAAGADAQAPGETGFHVQADGLAPIEKENVAAGRERAIADALQRAVERTVGTLVSAEAQAQQDALLRSKLYPDTGRYVQTYRILSEVPASGLYQVSVEAVVAREPVRQALIRLGLLAGGGPPAGPLGVLTVTARGATRQAQLTTLTAALTERGQAQRIRYRSLSPGVVALEVETPLPPQALADELSRLQVEGARLTVAPPDGRRLEVTFTPAR